MIRLEKVYKRYADGFQALTDINLDLEAGKIHVFIGPSGCGKSTTMKLINRLITPSEGKIFIDGEDITGVNPVQLRRKIGYVIQNIGLFPHMTISENVAVVPRLLKWDEDKIQNKVNELLSLVNLPPETYKNRYPGELSGGQQQRVGVIRALAAEPDIILMDEPFSALDPISREQLQDELTNLQENIQKTIIFVTHDMDEAIKIADNIVLMKAGEVVQVGTPEQILRHPANDFVKEFIGKKRLVEHRENPFLNSFDAEGVPSVKDVMIDKPVTASPSRGLASSLNLMEQRRVDSLIIVDKNRKLLGYAPILNVLSEISDETKVLADVMQSFKFAVKPDDPFTVALEFMGQNNAPYVPVVNDANVLVGAVTRGSIVRLMSEVYPVAEEVL
ncbi:osmoprotectant transport system ATP-binding protein [Peribacillus deserti]|uniref:Quaternary amine transport ATP-binding protein n=1 Tax=Peribacillus deserti TaxID=673318 RepID=A0ABS2QIW3_9BACI|nr:betaine/proline/choline family ABC transporter ATP-binding protein [Peribacillus deserti]MBM7693082.1 osmoprotectant transport system ATP-binding protein [Peribacillus deserti]